MAGKPDIEEYVDQICTDEIAVPWDEEKYTFEQYKNIVRKTVKKVTKEQLKQGGGEIDDWNYFEYVLYYECNQALGNN